MRKLLQEDKTWWEQCGWFNYQGIARSVFVQSIILRDSTGGWIENLENLLNDVSSQQQNQITQRYQFFHFIPPRQYKLNYSIVHDINTFEKLNLEEEVISHDQMELQLANSSSGRIKIATSSSDPTPVLSINIQPSELPLIQNCKISKKHSSFVCKICQNSYEYMYQLYRHRKIHKELDKVLTIGCIQKFQCRTCPKHYTSKSARCKHEVKHKQRNKQNKTKQHIKPYKCKYCTQMFAHQPSQSRHQKKCLRR